MNALRLKTYVMIALMTVLGCTGDMLLSLAMKRMDPIQSWSLGPMLSLVQQAISSPTVWVGIALLCSFFVCYLIALSWADFSYLKPSMAVSYAFVTFLASTVLGEVVSPRRWAGVALICLGVATVGLTKVRTAAAHQHEALRKVEGAS